MKKLSETEERILAVAERLFAEQGFDATSVRDICTAAEVNIAAIHYHFKDKESLYIEAVKRAHTCSMPGEGFPPVPEGVTPIQRLEHFLRNLIVRMHAPANPVSLKLLMREMASPGKATHIVVQEFIQPMAFQLRSILQDVLPGLDPHRLLMVGFSIMGQVLYYRQNRPVSELIFGQENVESLTTEMVTDHILRFTFAALGFAEPIRTSDTGTGD